MTESLADKWKDRLEPFASAYSGFRRAIDDRIKDMSDEELTALLAATDKPSETNCWWATYQVAPIVKERASVERHQRAALKAVRG